MTMVQGDETPKAKAPGRGLKTALVVSLAVNLLVAGIVGGAVLSHGDRGAHDMRRDVGFGPYTEALSREDRAALFKAFMAASPGFRDMRREVRQDFSRLVGALRAEPWDASAVEAVIDAQTTRTAERLDLGRRLLIERIVQMSPEQRRAFADRIEAAPRRERR
jgi:uncharacterized membrane protein